jgi:hypothetical protein
MPRRDTAVPAGESVGGVAVIAKKSQNAPAAISESTGGLCRLRRGPEATPVGVVTGKQKGGRIRPYTETVGATDDVGGSSIVQGGGKRRTCSVITEAF